MTRLLSLTKENIEEIAEKLSILFEYGSYGTDIDTFVPQVVIQESNKGWQQGLRISTDVSLMMSSEIVIPLSAYYTSTEDEDTDWDEMETENPMDMPEFTFRWNPRGGDIRYKLEISGTMIQFTGFDTIADNKLFSIAIA